MSDNANTTGEPPVPTLPRDIPPVQRSGNAAGGATPIAPIVPAVPTLSTLPTLPVAPTTPTGPAVPTTLVLGNGNSGNAGVTGDTGGSGPNNGVTPILPVPPVTGDNNNGNTGATGGVNVGHTGQGDGVVITGNGHGDNTGTLMRTDNVDFMVVINLPTRLDPRCIRPEGYTSLVPVQRKADLGEFDPPLVWARWIPGLFAYTDGTIGHVTQYAQWYIAGQIEHIGNLGDIIERRVSFSQQLTADTVIEGVNPKLSRVSQYVYAQQYPVLITGSRDDHPQWREPLDEHRGMHDWFMFTATAADFCSEARTTTNDYIAAIIKENTPQDVLPSLSRLPAVLPVLVTGPPPPSNAPAAPAAPAVPAAPDAPAAPAAPAAPTGRTSPVIPAVPATLTGVLSLPAPSTYVLPKNPTDPYAVGHGIVDGSGGPSQKDEAPAPLSIPFGCTEADVTRMAERIRNAHRDMSEPVLRNYATQLLAVGYVGPAESDRPARTLSTQRFATTNG